jgi:hypothetical protein
VASAPRDPRYCYLVLTLDELSAEGTRHSVLMAWADGRFGKAGQTAWHTAGLAALAAPPREHAVAVGEYGHCVAYGPGGYLVRERIGDDSTGPRRRGPLRGVRAIGGCVYVVGMDRQAYLRRGENDWVSIAAGLPPGDQGAAPVGLEAVDGFGEDDIYAVGWDGEIWHSNGTQWRSVASPTNLILTDVCCAGDGKVYACGRRGLLVVGRSDSWSVIVQGAIMEDIWGLAWFRDRLYLATFAALYALKDGVIAIVDTGSDPAETYYRLATWGNVLVSTGAKDVMAFDGAAWTRID